MLKRVLAVAILASFPAAARAEFVLDDFTTFGSLTSGSTLLSNGFTRDLAGTGLSGNLFEINGGNINNFKVRAQTSVTATYTTPGSLSIAGMNLLRMGMDLSQNIGVGDSWDISVALTGDGGTTETAVRTVTNDSSTFGVDLTSISGSVRRDIQSIQITWFFDSPLTGPPAAFGSGSGSGGFTFTPEPGSLVLLGGASLAGLAFLRRRRKARDEKEEPEAAA